MPDFEPLEEGKVGGLLMPPAHTTHHCPGSLTCCELDSLAREVLAGRRLREAVEKTRGFYWGPEGHHKECAAVSGASDGVGRIDYWVRGGDEAKCDCGTTGVSSALAAYPQPTKGEKE